MKHVKCTTGKNRKLLRNIFTVLTHCKFYVLYITINRITYYDYVLPYYDFFSYSFNNVLSNGANGRPLGTKLNNIKTTN